MAYCCDKTVQQYLAYMSRDCRPVERRPRKSIYLNAARRVTMDWVIDRFYLSSSVLIGDTFIFGVVEDTDSSFASNVSFIPGI